jgi:hypothetical protein
MQVDLHPRLLGAGFLHEVDMKLLVAVACVCLALGSALRASDNLKAIVGSYLELHAQLAADKTEGVKAAASALAARADGMGEGAAALAKAARAVGAAADLKAARDAFGPLSDAVIALGEAEGWKDADGVKVAFCPMAKRSWIQTDEKLRNPYYGSSMLECGGFKK